MVQGEEVLLELSGTDRNWEGDSPHLRWEYYWSFKERYVRKIGIVRVVEFFFFFQVF